METVKKIYPSPTELLLINTNIQCPEEGCSGVFTSESNLNLHLAKTHKQEQLLKSDKVPKEYYCPESSCDYHFDKHFKNLKLVKQHYLKVHSEKMFVCDGCQQGFSTLAAKTSHSSYCGIMFTCCDCDTSYKSYESLLTHGRRKSHLVMQKSLYKTDTGKSLHRSSSGPNLGVSCKEMFVLPKPKHVKSETCITYEKSSQTEANNFLPKQLKTKHIQVGRAKNSKNTSQHSQTSISKHLRSSIETQTIGDYAASKRLKTANELTLSAVNAIDALKQKSINTQTKPVDAQTKSCNTSFELEKTQQQNDLQTTSSGTQTATSIQNDLLYSISTATHDSIHTDTSDLNFHLIHSSSQTCFEEDMSDFDSSTFLNCSIETQTDLMFDGKLLDLQECYPDQEEQVLPMQDFNLPYPKACEDVLFSTSQTQTWIDDIAKSVEIQTMLSQNKFNSLIGCRDTAHIHTQTEIDFKKLLEEINA